jgi:hypothetical protein
MRRPAWSPLSRIDPPVRFPGPLTKSKMSNAPEPLLSSTRPVDPALSDLLQRIQPGQRIRVTQTVRVGSQEWQAVVVGAFRHVNYLVTGLATDRKPEDDIVVPIVHFTKENGELSSITIDEHTRVEAI